MLETIVKALILPCGLIWILMIVALLSGWRHRDTSAYRMLVLIFLIYSVAGNSWVGNRLLHWLEQDYRDVQPLQQTRFDAVFVLGGGTHVSPTGMPELSLAGDRVMLAARLFRHDKADYIVCTGREATYSGADQAATILQDIGVPQDRILQLDGSNTKEEIALIAQMVEERGWSNVGLVTSAWHMRRALALAESKKLELQPLPANFRGSKGGWNWATAIPTASGLEENQVGCKEVIGSFVGR